MDDIDRTFLKLKRATFEQVKMSMPIYCNMHTYELEFREWDEAKFEKLGWTVEEANKELIKLLYPNDKEH